MSAFLSKSSIEKPKELFSKTLNTDHFISSLNKECEFKSSEFPKAYLSSNLIEQISQANHYRNLSNIPIIKKKTRVQTAATSKVTNKAKLFSLESVNSHFLYRYSHNIGCICCKARSLSCEDEFVKLIEEKKEKTSLAKKEFDFLCREKNSKLIKKSFKERTRKKNANVLKNNDFRLSISRIFNNS